MTAIIALNTVAAPLGFLVAGQVIDRVGTSAVFCHGRRRFHGSASLALRRRTSLRHLRIGPEPVLET